MSGRLQRCRRFAAAMIASMLFFNASSCLPKDFFFNLAGATRTVVLDTASTVLIDGIVDTLFPGLPGENGDDTGAPTAQ